MRRKAREENDIEDYPAYEEEPIASTSGSGENEDFFARHKYFIFAAIAVFMLLAAATAVFVLPALSGTATGKDLLGKPSLSKLFAGSTDANAGKNAAGAATGAAANATKTATKPTLLSLDILEAPYTNSQSVTLSLFARNAEQCRYANEDGSWSNYELYEVESYWQLTAGDDAKTVSYQCKNGDKESEIVTASITLDTTAPEVTLSASGSKSSVAIETQTSDSLSGVKTCQVYIDGNSVDSFPGGDYSKQYTTNLATGVHTISVSCKDAAGNTGVAQASLTVDATKTETKKAETKKNRQITVKINGGA
ncbi:MAG: Ig-like domain-containing protein, partial [Candidatus Micrarchaeota archaeon]